MPIFKNHRGQLHKANTVFAAFTAIYVIGGLAILSTPLWRPSTCKLAAFAATPLGMGVLVLVTAALTCLAIYAINKNNKISELKASRIVVSSDDAYLVLQVSSEDSKFIEENYKVGDEHRIDCANSKGEVYRITLECQVKYKDHKNPILLGSTYLFHVSSLEVKDGKGEYVLINDSSKQLETLGLGLGDQHPKELSITFMPSTVVQEPAAKQVQEEEQKNRQLSIKEVD